MSRPKFIILLGCLSLLACKASLSIPEDLDEAIQLEMERDHIPSLVACIIKNDQVVWQQFYRLEDLKSQPLPTENTSYLLASISKTFVATATFQLWQDGLIDLDEDINAYLPFSIRNPHFPNSKITPRMLLTHTASLSWPTNSEDPVYNNTYIDDTAPALFPWIKNYLTPEKTEYRNTIWKNYAPGSLYQYSNIGISLLAFVIESIVGQDFRDFCEQHIFDPLGMPNSGYRLSNVDPEFLGPLYHDQRLISQYSIQAYPAAMVRSSLKELSHYLIAIMNGGVFNSVRILDENSVREMLTPQLNIEGLAHVWKTQAPGWIGHIGGYWGSTSLMDFHPEEKIGVILLSNTYDVRSIYPDGAIYQLIHEKASAYADN